MDKVKLGWGQWDGGEGEVAMVERRRGRDGTADRQRDDTADRWRKGAGGNWEWGMEGVWGEVQTRFHALDETTDSSNHSREHPPGDPPGDPLGDPPRQI